jgi:DUF4097 and DUF4098 domain-containing protein YvlB
MVKEGKLTIDEALTLLEELEKNNSDMKEKVVEHQSEVSTVVNFEEAKQENTSSNHKYQSTKDKIFEFVDMAIKKIKDFDLDFNFGKSIDISHIFQQGDVYLKEIDIDVANGFVKLVPWDQQDVRVECEAKVYRVDTQEEARNTFLQDVIFAIEGQKLRFVTQQKWMKVNATFYVPQAAYDDIKIRMFNGSIDSKNLDVTKYKVKTANGKINISDVKSKNVEAETANGQIEASRCHVEDFDAETINGAIKIDGSFKVVDVQSFNGNIDCTLTNTDCGFIEAKATTGGIKLYVPANASLSGEIKSNLGGFHLDVDGIQIVEEKKDVVQKLIRFRPIVENVSSTRILADAKTGSVSITQVK